MFNAVAFASSSVASSSTPVEWGSSSLIAVAAHDLAVIRFGTPALRTSAVVVCQFESVD
jgi:hypothetical protein